jgi:hypothetical protein
LLHNTEAISIRGDREIASPAFAEAASRTQVALLLAMTVWLLLAMTVYTCCPALGHAHAGMRTFIDVIPWIRLE